MLQAIKDKIRGWVAYVVIGLLAVPFAFFGVFSYFQPSSNPTVAEVNGTEIKQNELKNTVRQQREQLQQRLGERFDPDQFSDERLRRQALDQLIERQVLETFATANGLTAPDGAVAEQVRNYSQFQKDGEFSEERYREALSRSNINMADFEQRLRDEATVAAVREGVTSSSLVTDVLAERTAAVQYQRRHLAAVRIKAEALREDVELGDEAIASFYEDNKESFRRPRQVRLAYLELSPDTASKDVSISDKALRQRYEQVKEQRGEPERRRTRHIQIKLDDDPSEGAVQAAREKLRSLREDIEAGELSFEKAAREHSEDSLSAKKGGKLGVIAPGDLGGAFEERVFALDEGRLSEPVRTSSGLHLIRVTEVMPAERPSFEDIKGELKQSLIEERSAERIAQKASRLKNLTYKNPQSLKPAANALSLRVRETDWFNQRGADEGLASNDKIVKAAFSEPVLEQGRNSEAIEIGDDRRVVVRVTEQKPSRIPPLDEVRDQVVERLRSQRLADVTKERGDELIEQVREGGKRFGSLEDEREAVSLTEYGWITRRQQGDVPRRIMATAFRMPRPADDAIELEGTRVQGGDYAVIALRGVEDGSLDGLSDKQRRQLRQALSRSNQTSSQNEFIAALRNAADVTIYDRRLGGADAGGGP